MLAAVAFSLVVAGVSASTSVGETGDEDLRRASVWAHRGAPTNPPAGTARVRLMLVSQPLLEAASSDRSQTALRPRPETGVRAAARRRPGQISQLEVRAARSAERSYETAIAGLDSAVSQANADVDRVALRVERRGGRVVDYELAPASLVVRIPDRKIPDLQHLRAVRSTEPAPRPAPLSGIGTQVVGAPAWWSAGHTGGTGPVDTVAADAAIESEAADPTHPAFSAVTVDNDPETAVSDHGTHTGGIIASGDATFKGVAFGIDRLIGSAGVAYALGLDVDGENGAADPAEVISLSFGSTAASDDADDGDDVLTSVFGVGQAQGAGNDNVDGTPSVANIGRNVLSVGAFNDVGTVDSSDDVVLGVSSRGPTPGGRKKPDLTAPGGAVIAPSSLWNSPPSNPDFTGASGTSFSAPHVAGAMTLLEGAGIGDPMAQRAILINSARDWNGTTTGLDGWAPPQASWRPEVGWGELDLDRALAERGNYQLGDVRGGDAAFYRATVPVGAKATLAFEMRGFFVGFPNPGTQTIKYTQSNLDLRQYLLDGSEVPPPTDPGHGGGPDAVDPNDTVEQVRAPAGGPQQITYKVEASSSVVGADAEPFAITAAAPLSKLEAPDVRPVDIGATSTGAVRCGVPVTVTASLRNDSDDLVAGDAEVTLDPPVGVDLVSGQATQEVSAGDLEAGATSEQHSWTVQATTDGPKEISISGVGTGLGTPFTKSEEIIVDADCTPPGTTIDAGPIGPTNDSTPTFSFSSEAGSTFECALDGLTFQVCDDPFTAGELADGTHSFAVRAVDEVGNVDASPAESQFLVDTLVSGPESKLLSRRLFRRKSSLGRISAGMEEPGRVRVTGKAKFGRRTVSLRSSARDINGNSVELPLRASKRAFEKVRRARRHGKRVRLDVSARFSDGLDNQGVQRIRYRIR